MRKSIATVSVSGALPEKLVTIAAAGFDGVEIFENDLLSCTLSPEEVGNRARDLGLSIEMYQPFRDFEAMPAPDLRRAERKFRIMRRLGADLLLVCSNVSPAAIDDDEIAAEHLALLAEQAAEYGIRIAYEALAWGRHVNEYLHAWRIVRMADRPNLGVCLDSFHILSRGSDPIGIEAIPGDKIFFLQLADAPRLAMDVLQWSRHHRCFPGQGSFDLTGFLGHVRTAGYAGPLSLEVFNDHFRQADAHRISVDAMRSLIALEVHPTVSVREVTFVEVGAPDVAGRDSARLREILAALGFTRGSAKGEGRGVFRTDKEIWEQGRACVVVGKEDVEPSVVAIGLESSDPDAAVQRAESLLAPVLADNAVSAPDGIRISFFRTAQSREDADRSAAGDITHIDHIALAQPLHYFDEAELFYRSVLCLDPQEILEVPDPYGLLRSKAMTSPGAGVRMVINVAEVGAGRQPRQVGPAPPTQHVALASSDLLVVARRLHDKHPELVLPIPDNYYDDLEARHEVDPELRELNVMYDLDEAGEFLHFYLVATGRVFFEVVQRKGGYQGYGVTDAAVRLAVQRALVD